MATASEKLQLILEAQVRGSEEMRKLNEQLDRFRDGTKKASDSAGNTPGFDAFAQKIKAGIQDPLGAAGDAAQGFLTKLGPVGAGAAAIGTVLVATGAAVFTLAKSFGDLYEQQSNNAVRLGVSIREYGLLSRVSSEAGLSGDALVGTMKGLSKALSDNSDEGKIAKDALRGIGVAATDAFGASRPMRDMLLDIADKLGAVSNPAEKASTAIKVLGRAGLEVLPLMNSQLRQQIEELEQAGAGWNAMSEKVGAATDKAMDRLDRSWSQAAKRAKQWGAEIALAFLDHDSYAEISRLRNLGLAEERMKRTAVLEGRSLPPQFARPGVVTDDQVAAMDVSRRRREIEQIMGNDLQRQALDVKKDLDRAIQEANVDEVGRLTREYKSLEAQIKAAQKAESERQALTKLAADVQIGYAGAILKMRGIGQAPTANAPGPLELASQLDMTLFEVDAEDERRRLALRRPINPQQAFAGAFSRDVSEQTTALQRNLELTMQAYEYRARIVEAMAGPGGEVAAIRAVSDLKLQALEDEKRLGVEEFEITKQRNQILMDQQLAILNYQKQREASARQAGGQIFDAITAGGGGLQNYVKGLALGQGRTVFGNAYQIATTGLEGKLSLTNDPNSFLGKLLGGTPFGADPMKQAADIQLKAATIMMGAATTMAGGRGGTGGSAISQAIGLMSGGGSGGTVSLPPYMMPSTSTTGAAFDTSDDWFNYAGNLPGGSGGMTTAAKFGAGAALIGGGYGIYSGAQQGGARGALTAAASTAGIVAMLPSLMPAIGKALPLLGPIGAIAGIGLGLVGMFLPDPKQKRAKDLESEAANRRFTEPTGTDYVTDLYGRRVDYNKGGELRPIIVQVSAMDSKSFIDRQEDIGEAVRQAIDSYPPLTNSMRSAVLALG